MPAIRDSSWVATTVATGTTLVIPMPASELNDLLVAVIAADTSGGTWTAPGWTHVTGSPSLNTCQMVVMWKLAIATEAASYTFTGTVAESYNGSIISIRDTNTTNPFGVTPVINFTTQASAAKFNMQQITTNTANSLILYASANSAVGVPSLLEGPVYGILGADGVAESLGIGWGFQATAGLTSAVVGVSNIAAGAGVKLALQIAPPVGGAQVVPGYCAEDLCTYLNPINGTTAYNGNTALAATADTNYGTSLGGLVAGDATVAAITDVGINSFHSAARLTSLTGVTTLSGADLVFAAGNRPNITNKNILVHVGPSTEGQLQRFSSVASGRGIWFGARSAAASNYKIWQVYGVELGSARHQPVVIHPDAPNAKATNGTLNPAGVLSLGFWVSGKGVGTTAWDLASLWLMDLTTICGGNSLEPLGIPGIVEAAANGKERKSVIRQGSGQALSYQALQFGNGGTSPVYLGLDSTAIEFPGQYNAAEKRVTYNSVDNVIGLNYFAGASDVIKHTNSVVSSPSDYHWRINASSSASATYDFSGLSVIGAGDVVLRNVTTFTSMSFVNCTTITQNSASLASCSFTNSFLLSNTLSVITNCSFTSSGTGHAIEITVPGSYTFTGNTFTGYGAIGTTNAAIYNNSGGAVTVTISGGGDTPTYRNGVSATTNVVSGATITFTGLPTGTDIVILTAGTSTILDQVDANPGTFYAWGYSGTPAVDVGFIKPGKIPLYIRNLALTSSNVSLPVSLSDDRNYQV